MNAALATVAAPAPLALRASVAAGATGSRARFPTTAAATAALAVASATTRAVGRGAGVAGQRFRRSAAGRSARCQRRAVRLEMGEKVVGIDLGTTNSVIAAVEAGQPSIVPNAEGERVTPSVVAFSGEGGKDVLVGRRAKRQAALNPRNTFHSVKRLLGRRFSEVSEHLEAVAYGIEDRGSGQVFLQCPIAGCSLAPEEVSAHVLRKLRQDAASYLNATVSKAVITVPAYFDDAQRQATKTAAGLAGLEVLRICNEPTMAALAYGLDQKNMSTVVVLDLGGGTFDVSVLEVGDGVCEVLGTAGDGHLGGDDFDQRIMKWLLARFEVKEGVDLSKDPQALQRLLEAAERAKVDLSTVQEARISVPFVAADENGPKHVDEVLTRVAFEELCGDLVQRLRAPVQRALKDGRTKAKDVSEVVLVGGSGRIPAVREMAKELTLGKPINSVVNPDEAVAVGAALQAAMIAGEVQDIMLIDVTPLTLGVETNGGIFTPVVERNSTVPAKGTRLFTTSADAQDEIEVVVLQGERPLAADNKMLGKFRLKGIPPAPAGIPKIEVTFALSLEGILTVSAKDWATRKKVQIKLDGINNVDDREVDRIFQEAEAKWMDDERRKEELELQYAAGHLVRQQSA